MVELSSALGHGIYDPFLGMAGRYRDETGVPTFCPPMLAFDMNETIVGTVFSDDALADVRSTVKDMIGGLNSVAQMLETYGAENASVSRGHLEVMARTLRR